MSRTRINILLILLIAPLSLTLAQSTSQWEELQLKADSLLKRNGSAGASLIVVSRDSVIVSEGFGYTSLESQKPVTDSTLFVLGSITKTFTALGILKLVEEGKMHLDDKVQDIAPELPVKNIWEESYPLRVYHLLEHTSGFDGLHLKDRSIPVSNDDFPLIDGIDIVRNSMETRWKPGTRFSYSNVGYLVAGYIIEKVSGRQYNDFIAKKVLVLLEMNNSSLRLEDINQHLLAKSYSSAKKEEPFKHIFTRPTGSLMSNSHDMGHFMMMLLNNGENFLKKSSITKFETHHSIKAFYQTQNGYRLGIYPRFRNGRIWFGHGGSINKYNAEFEYCRKLGLAVFIVSNGPNATKTVDGILSAFHEIIPEPGKIQRDIEKSIDGPEINALEGYYMFSSPRHQFLYPFTDLFTEGLFIEAGDESITVSRLNRKPSKMSRSGKNSFSPTGQVNENQYVFTSDDSLYTSLGHFYKKSSFFLVFLLGVGLLIAFFIICLSQIVLLVHLIKIMRSKALHIRPQLTLEIGSSIFLLGFLLYLAAGTIEGIHKPQFVTIMLMLCTILFPVITAAGLAHTFSYNFKDFRSKLWTLSMLFSTTLWSFYLIYWGFFGFAVWGY